MVESVELPGAVVMVTEKLLLFEVILTRFRFKVPRIAELFEFEGLHFKSNSFKLFSSEIIFNWDK